MIKRLPALLLFMLATAFAYSQDITLKGRLTDKADNTPIAGASISLVSQRDTANKRLVVTDARGNFQFNGLNASAYTLTASNIGYEGISQRVALQASNKEPITFTLNKLAATLGEVVVKSQAPPVRQKADTSEFSASQFKVNPDATAEDLIKKLPGITVGKDGTVTALGEQVKKVTIDGKDFFGDDASAALKNLPSEVIDKIQVFDRLSDQAQLTGFDDGNSVKAINIVTKSGIKNGQFGRAYVGYGTDDRYTAGGNVSFFNGNRRISLVGNFNNINQQNFGSQDLLGVTSSGGGNRGGGNRGGGRGGGGTDNFSVGQASGISKTNAFGINYNDKWGKKLTVSGSYFFNNSTNNNASTVNTETFGINGKNLFSTQNSNTVTKNTNNRINMRFEYKIDSSNSLFVIPSISFQNNKSRTFSSSQTYYGENDSVNTSLGNYTTDRDGYNIRNSILFRHAFAKRGRSLSIGLNTTWSKNDGESLNDVSYRFFDNGVINDSAQNQVMNNPTTGTTIGGSIAYTEPIGKFGQLQIDYNPSVQKNKANQQTFLYDGAKYSLFDTSLSNKFDNTVTTHNAGVNYRLSKNRDAMLSIGVNFQYSKLESDRVFPTVTAVNQSFTNFLPNAMWRKKLSASSNIRVFYRASTNFPSVTQLQDVVNLNNPLRVSSGNPDLKQSYVHLLSGRYTYTNSKTGRSFFANLFLQTAGDYISTATYIASADSTIQNGVVLKQGSQLSKPVNLDGYRSLRTLFNYSMPLKFIKTALNLTAGFNYSKLPGLVNGSKTTTNNYVYTGGVALVSNISEYVDFNLSYTANFNNTQTINTTTINNNYVNQATSLQVNLLNKKGWFIQNDISNQSYTGLSAGLNQSYWLWNAAIGKKFLKNNAGELKLSVFDLLKQNQSIVRTVTESYIEDVQSQVLQQYFMLTFTYNLKNFGKGRATMNNSNRGGDFRGGPGMGMGPQF